MDVPSDRDMRSRQLQEWVDDVKTTEVPDGYMDTIVPDVMEKLDGLNKRQIVGRMLASEFNGSLTKNGRSNGKSTNGSSKKYENSPENGYERFFVNLGKKHNLKPGDLIGMINQETRSGSIDIGKIDLMGSFSFFEADMQHTDLILSSFRNNVSYRGNSVNVEVAKPDA